MKKETMDVLIRKGVRIPNPESVFISEDVDADRISGDGVTLYAGCKLVGGRTLILPNVELGYEAPVTLEDCCVGANSKLKGGFFQGAVFMGDNAFGSGAHVRSGTILEEQANAAHTVGLKQTILFPFVTLGSLINFCDCFMAGGTSRKDHSEVGSSFIHFNYTPNQDKATPSMMGNVHQGVMLDQPPIFLGGQGGLVGPLRMGFGCITAAGSVIRKDEEKMNCLIMGGGFKSFSMPRQPQVYTQVSRIFNRNIQYIAALIALKSWYVHIRPLFAQGGLALELVKALQDNLDGCIRERIKRLGDFCQNLAASRSLLIRAAKQDAGSIQAHDRAMDRFGQAEIDFRQAMAAGRLNPAGEGFLRKIEPIAGGPEKSYISVIRELAPEDKALGVRWLQEVETQLTASLYI